MIALKAGDSHGDTATDFLGRKAGFHSRAGGGHGIPVGNVDKYAFDEGPGPAHTRFDRVDTAAILLIKDAVSVRTLGEDQTAAGSDQVSFPHGLRRYLQEGRQRLDIVRAHIGTAESLTAVATLHAFEQIVATHDASIFRLLSMAILSVT
jgi:hypothetical protein